MSNLIEVLNLNKSFGNLKKLKVLKKISYKFKKGRVYSLMGPSGSGKSTLLNLISLIDRPTSGSIVIGEDKVCAEIRRGAPYATATTLVSGVVAALNQLEAKKIVIGTPYLDEINIVEKNFFENKGFDVLDIQGLNLGNGIEFGKITPDYIKDFALSIDQKESEVIFLSCSGIRSLDIIEELEATTGKPVITSNQAQMWYALRTAGVNDKLSGFGRIFNS